MIRQFKNMIRQFIQLRSMTKNMIEQFKNKIRQFIQLRSMTKNMIEWFIQLMSMSKKYD